MSCVVKNCFNRTSRKSFIQKDLELQRKKTIRFHRFPKDAYKKALWLQAIEQPNIILSDTTTICSVHFEDNCFDDSYRNEILKDDAVPTVFSSNFNAKPSPISQKLIRPSYKKSTLKVTETEEISEPRFQRWQQNCRLCFKYISSDSEFLRKNGQFTELGLQFSTITDFQESYYEDLQDLHCCSECALEIQTCFLIYVRIRTVESYVLNTNQRNESTSLITCKDCLLDLQGIHAVIEHTIQHLLKQVVNIELEEAVNIEEDTKLSRYDETDYFQHQFEDFTDKEKQVLCHDVNNDNDVLSDIMTDDDDDEVIEIINYELDCHDDTDDDEVFNNVDVEINDNQYSCSECDQIFTYKFELRHHLVCQHLPSSDIDLLGVIPKGDKVRKRIYKNLRRRRMRSLKKRKPNSLDENDSEYYILCTYCYDLFHRGDVFNSHVRGCRVRYANEGTKLCIRCGALLDAAQYKKHICNGLRNELCPKCKKHFSKSRVNKHKPCYEFERVACDRCGSLVVKDKLMDHMRRKHDEQARSQCPICEKLFSYYYEVDAHLLLHRHFDVLFKRTCRRCNEEFTDLTEFQDHLVNEHRLYQHLTQQCDYCKRKILEHALLRHLETEHNILQTSKIKKK